MDSSFVFTLSPKVKAYYKTDDNVNNIIDIAPDRLSIGRAGPAIYLDHELYRGFSAPSRSFQSPSLAEGEDFRCLSLEVWLLE